MFNHHIIRQNMFRLMLRRSLSYEKTMNKVTLLGRAGGDAQLKGNEEHPVVIFSIATNSNSKTEWHRVSVFRPGLREVAEEYVKAGTRVLVEGKISYGHIIDRNGAAVPTTSIIADDLIFLTKPVANQNDNATSDQMETQSAN